MQTSRTLQGSLCVLLCEKAHGHCCDTPGLQIQRATFRGSASFYQPVKRAVNLPHRVPISCWWMKIPVTQCRALRIRRKPHVPQKSPSQEQPLQDRAVRGDFEVMSFLLFQGAIYRGTCFHKIGGQKGWISYCIVRGESLDPSRSVAKFPLTSMRAGIPPCSLLRWTHFHMETLCHSQTDVKFSFSFSTHTTGTH